MREVFYQSVQPVYLCIAILPKKKQKQKVCCTNFRIRILLILNYVFIYIRTLPKLNLILKYNLRKQIKILLTRALIYLTRKKS